MAASALGSRAGCVCGSDAVVGRNVAGRAPVDGSLGPPSFAILGQDGPNLEAKVLLTLNKIKTLFILSLKLVDEEMVERS